jgi:hypothetical protein
MANSLSDGVACVLRCVLVYLRRQRSSAAPPPIEQSSSSYANYQGSSLAKMIVIDSRKSAADGVPWPTIVQ